LAAVPRAESIGSFASSIDADWIRAALEATGTASVRRRRLPAEQAVWMVIGMSLYRDRPIFDVVDSMDLALPGRGPLARSAVSAARARLGAEPLEHLFRACGEAWGCRSADRARWRDLAIYGADGTTLRVPDTPANRAGFGAPRYGGGEASYPQARVVALFALRNHAVVDAALGPYTDGEATLARNLWKSVPDRSVTLLDRNFLSASVLLGLQRGGAERHWICPAKSNSKWKDVETLGKGDRLVERKVSPQAREQDPGLPETWVMRAIKVERKGHRPRWLLTSLVDAKAYPAAEVVALYCERWEAELAFDEIKTEVLDREETIRSKSPELVRQEAWGLLLAYNLVRVQMERVADQAKVEPTRISFSWSLRIVTDEWMWDVWRAPGAIPKRITRLMERISRCILPPRRRGRSYPRAVKIPSSSYPSRRHTAPKGGAK
jgi:hypothetical protein